MEFQVLYSLKYTKESQNVVCCSCDFSLKGLKSLTAMFLAEVANLIVMTYCRIVNII